jgi:hypothetical protein
LSEQEKYRNNTGVTAYDLAKIIKGHHKIIYAIHHKFSKHRVFYLGSWFTIIKWYDGSVNNGDWTWACFRTAGYKPIRVLAAFWTDSNQHIIGRAGPAIGKRPRYAVNGNIVLDLYHDWSNWTGEAFPPEEDDTAGAPLGQIDVNNVRYAVTNTLRPLEDLNDALLDPNLTPLTWMPLSNCTLNYGGSASYDLGLRAPEAVILFAFDAAGEGQTSSEIIQFQPQEATPIIPTVSEWGLIIMAALLVTAGAVVIVRRRQRVAA